MMGFSPPQPECQIVDCKAAYYDGDTDDLPNVVRHLKTVRRVSERMNVLLPSLILAR